MNWMRRVPRYGNVVEPAARSAPAPVMVLTWHATPPRPRRGDNAHGVQGAQDGTMDQGMGRWDGTWAGGWVVGWEGRYQPTLNVYRRA